MSMVSFTPPRITRTSFPSSGGEMVQRAGGRAGAARFTWGELRKAQQQQWDKARIDVPRLNRTSLYSPSQLLVNKRKRRVRESLTPRRVKRSIPARPLQARLPFHQFRYPYEFTPYGLVRGTRRGRATRRRRRRRKKMKSKKDIGQMTRL